MKELSIEEKAKAYNGVREKIAIRFGSNVADEIFSQFEMSEDERIRQFLIHEVKETSDKVMSYRNMNKKAVLAWLEKQGGLMGLIFMDGILNMILMNQTFVKKKF